MEKFNRVTDAEMAEMDTVISAAFADDRSLISLVDDIKREINRRAEPLRKFQLFDTIELNKLMQYLPDGDLKTEIDDELDIREI